MTMVRAIPMSNGSFAYVDEADAALVERRRWHQSSTGHVMANTGKGKCVLMHRLIITGYPEVDHKNGDTRDNTRVNLRGCTHRENLRNTKRRTDNTTGYKGVTRSRNGNYVAQISINGRHMSLGTFRTAAEASQAYDRGAKEAFGEYARVNGGEEGKCVERVP